ncbi:MAG TPA: hypothetical protein DIW85_13820 [Stenotrophomonas sp.]|nr:hypothetical protein [Stenotrophomonas sp.]
MREHGVPRPAGGAASPLRRGSPGARFAQSGHSSLGARSLIPNPWSGCYEKAGQMCPSGYVVFSKDGDEGNAIAVGNKNGFTSTQMTTRSMLVSCSH